MKVVYDSFRQGITMGKCKTKTIQTDIGTFRHNQAYSKPSVNLVYSELWYIQNSDIFKTRNIFRTLVYLEPQCIENSGKFKLKVYSDIYNVKHLRYEGLYENS